MNRPLRLALLTGCLFLGLLHTPAAWEAALEARSGPAESGLVRLPRSTSEITVAVASVPGEPRGESATSVAARAER